MTSRNERSGDVPLHDVALQGLPRRSSATIAVNALRERRVALSRGHPCLSVTRCEQPRGFMSRVVTRARAYIC